MGMRDMQGSCGTQRRSKQGQVSFEYLLIISFSFLLFVPLTILYLSTQADTREAITEGQTTRVAEVLRDAAERVYVAGDPARETITIKLPDGIESVTFDNTTIIYTIQSSNGNYTISADGFAPLSGSLPSTKGVHTVVVTAVGSGVVFS